MDSCDTVKRIAGAYLRIIVVSGQVAGHIGSHAAADFFNGIFALPEAYHVPYFLQVVGGIAAVCFKLSKQLQTTVLADAVGGFVDIIVSAENGIEAHQRILYPSCEDIVGLFQRTKALHNLFL